MKKPFTIGPVQATQQSHAVFRALRSTRDHPAVWPVGDLWQAFEVSASLHGPWVRHGEITARGGIAIDERNGAEFAETKHEVRLPHWRPLFVRARVRFDKQPPPIKLEVI